MNARHALKRAVYALLPEAWQEAVDRAFYERRLARGYLSNEWEFGLLSRFVKPGDTAVDVGANLGGYTVRLSELVGAQGVVHAFEPIPRTFRLLKHNVERLGTSRNVVLHQAAASDVSGRAEIHLPLEGKLPNYYTASLEGRGMGPVRVVSVRTTTLDNALAECPRVAFLKVDAEGAEWHVLQGARALLRQSHPVILCEIGGGILRFGRRPEEVFDLLAEFGYQAYQLIEERLSPVSGPERRGGNSNYVFLSAG